VPDERNALEAIRFYVSFACSFAFAERKLMEGNAKIIRLIARDEALHLTGTPSCARSGTEMRNRPKSASRSATTCSCWRLSRRKSGQTTCSATAP
jgi:ribonucleotide reductase beta subunit family protein with ferritin-like domain